LAIFTAQANHSRDTDSRALLMTYRHKLDKRQAAKVAASTLFITLSRTLGCFSMGNRQKRNIQFIVVSDPANANSIVSLQKARSHAARIAHARTRLARTVEYNSHKLPQAEIPIRGQDRNGDSREPVTRLQLRSSHSPLGGMSAGRRDPFDSFAANLNPTERFLLDHCKLLLPLDLP
jgi:hypothetical protein